MSPVYACRDFSQWRAAARQLLWQNVPPRDVVWNEDNSLFPSSESPLLDKADGHEFHVSRKFLSLAEDVAFHRDPGKWALLYKVLWRLTREEPRLLDISIDPDVYALMMMEKAVRRDAHKMTAFVRFRKVVDLRGEHYVAWHRPDHPIVRRVAPFFRDRFMSMRWTILTPDESVSWDGQALGFGPGVARSEAPAADELENLWLTYYGSIFNPARVNVRAMRKEMPVKHWATLPETALIAELLREAPARVEEMVKKAACPTTTSAADFVPASRELPVLAKAARKCQGCGIYCNATQVVFGEGPAHAKCMFVGEQPGDQEDLAGKPFVGPSGELLNQVMEEVGLPRDQVYVTNAVKHFKWEPRGKRRLHSKPSSREVAACRPWLKAEIEAVHPQMIICLGATASQSLLGAGFRLTQHRGQVQKSDWAPWLLATVHPSSLLRMPDPQARKEAMQQFTQDLKLASKQFQKLNPP